MRRRGSEEGLGHVNILAQCGTTVGRGKYSVKGGEGEVCVTSLIVVMAVKEAVVKGVAEWEGHPITSDVVTATKCAVTSRL